MVEDSGIATDGAAWVAQARADTLAALESLGTANARQLGKAVPALTEKLHLAVGKSYAATQGAHTRLLLNLGFDGAIVRGRPNGSWTTSEYTWSVTEQWLPGGFDRRAPTPARLPPNWHAATWAGSGPSPPPICSGGPVGPPEPTRRALTAIGAVEVDVPDGVGWVLPDDADAVDENDTPWIAFLPALDPTTMGWKERSWYLGDLGRFGASVFDRNGNAGPTIWIDGRVVGGWAQRKSGEISYRLLADVPPKRVKAIAAEADRVQSLIGDARVNVRFPAPMQKDLLA